MIRTQVIMNRDSTGRFTKIPERLDEFGQVYGQKMAEQLVLGSPVDTGAYMDGFYAGSSGGSTSSHGRPRNQPWQPYAQNAIGRMVNGIATLYGSTSMTFGNTAEHAQFVEYKYGPFTRARSMHSALLQQAWNEVWA